jgi:predicted O-methyltransferase YrrM
MGITGHEWIISTARRRVEVTKLKELIDLVFIDADKDGYIDYLKKLLRTPSV